MKTELEIQAESIAIRVGDLDGMPATKRNGALAALLKEAALEGMSWQRERDALIVRTLVYSDTLAASVSRSILEQSEKERGLGND